ncbi:MAG: hypothetical protein L0Y54_00360 [Sporichthyaceae bacterium]|nr:hypothetical protein [Sporichthyaceae bacterium]
MTTTSDPMPVALTAAGPHPDLQDMLDLYGQLVGVWDVDNRYLSPTDDQWHRGTVVWTFGWILDGRAVQDVMRFRFEDGSTPTGTTMRLLDPATETWTVVWFPPSGQVCTLVGRRVPDGIYQEGTQTDGCTIKWIFTEITPDSFHWQGYVKDTDESDWRLEQEMHGHRRRP